MNKTTIIITLILSVLTLSSCTDLPTADIMNETESPDALITHDSEGDIEYFSDYGSNGALSAEDFSIEDMLVYALEDEYAARSEYEYILNTFDVTTPFSNIIKSEETHIAMLIPLFEAYGFDVPEDASSSHLISISTLEETFHIGIQAEILNIAMYNLFLESDDLPDDVRDTFIKLRDASIKHQAAFEKNAATY